MSRKLKITWVRSIIASKEKHRRTIRALGLHRLHETVIRDDTPPIRGMIHAVAYMLKVEEVEA
ncbi:MAG: 50S ribosomal protein L30 [bacterium]|nr:50S ribosomal protein L30 [bacterium]